MRLSVCLVLALSFVVSLISPALGHAHQGKRHHVHRQGTGELARRDPGHVNLYKRYDNCRFTFYAVGLGACGQTSVSTDFVVALNSAQYNGGEYCFQEITITINGKTTGATIVDECPGCPSTGLDFSEGLFEFFADTSVGVLTGTWNFNSGGSSPTPAPAPSSSSPPPPPPPTTTSVDIPITTLLPSPTTTWQPSTTSTSASSTSSSSSSSATNSNSSSLVPTQTTSSVASPSAIPGETTNSSALVDVNSAIVYIGQFLSACSDM